MPIRVLLVDDHVMLRDGVAALLSTQDDIDVVGVASSGPGAIRLAGEKSPDLAILDLVMPEGGGVAALPLIIEASPRTRVIVLTMHDDAVTVRLALEAGASGFVMKCAAGNDLIAAVREVHAGRSFVRASLGERGLAAVIRPTLDPQRARIQQLSNRERTVLSHLAHGLTNKEIAAELGISVKSVDTYRVRLQQKLGVKGRAALVRYAIAAGVLRTG